VFGVSLESLGYGGQNGASCVVWLWVLRLW
jgi:hypothetical protein